jgi:hypothetical protein
VLSGEENGSELALRSSVSSALPARSRERVAAKRAFWLDLGVDPVDVLITSELHRTRREAAFAVRGKGKGRGLMSVQGRFERLRASALRSRVQRQSGTSVRARIFGSSRSDAGISMTAFISCRNGLEISRT